MMNMIIRHIATITLILLAVFPLGAEESKVDYKPAIHGVVRARYEYSTAEAESRFQVRNARLSIAGKVAAPVSYFIQTDLSDRGVMKILDAWARLGICDPLSLQAGQFRLPFGTDCFRGPGNYIFPNRSFIGKDINNVRGVGARLSYTMPLSFGRLGLDAGAFNPTSITDQNVWVSELAFAGKATLGIGNVTIAAGAQTISPDHARINLLGASASWSAGRWTLEGEYLNKHYTHARHKAANGYNVWADYRFPVKAGVFNQASFQARFDGMTDHSTGTRNDEGLLVTDNPGRNRVTGGATLTYLRESVRCDLRVSYEKYFYRRSINPSAGDNDKLCAEIVVKF